MRGELSIGNWFYGHGRHADNVELPICVPKQLGYITITGEYGVCNTNFKEEYNSRLCVGIPFSAEILKSIGFKEIENPSYINWFQYVMQSTLDYNEDGSINRDGVWYDAIGTIGGELIVNVLCRGNYICNALQYVHQIQNLHRIIGDKVLKVEL